MITSRQSRFFDLVTCTTLSDWQNRNRQKHISARILLQYMYIFTNITSIVDMNHF